MYGFAASSVRFLTVFGFCGLAVPNTICKSIENRAKNYTKKRKERKTVRRSQNAEEKKCC